MESIGTYPQAKASLSRTELCRIGNSLFYLWHATMDEVLKGSDSKCDVPWSESLIVESDNVSINYFKMLWRNCQIQLDFSMNTSVPQNDRSLLVALIANA